VVGRGAIARWIRTLRYSMITRVLLDPVDFRRLYLFRHPELEASYQGRAVGSGAAPLSRRGRAQVLDWVGWLENVTIDAVYSSPQSQCTESALAICKPRELVPIEDARLRDQEMGEWQGRPWEELLQQDGDAVRSFFTDFGDTKAKGGENLGESVERVLAWWVEVAPGAVGKSYAVVMPGSMIAGFVAALLGLRLSRSLSLNLPHGGLGIVDAYDNGVRLQSWNPGAVV
jgi:broad specificity phosphatase PhoE